MKYLYIIMHKYYEKTVIVNNIKKKNSNLSSQIIEDKQI